MTHIKKKLQPLQHIHGIWKPHIIHILPCVVSCYKSFKRRKKERKEGSEKREEEKKVIEFVSNTPMLANWCKLR